MLYRILVTALIPPESKEKIPDYFELDCFLEKRPMKYQELFSKVKHNDYDAMLCAYEDKIDESLLEVVGKRLKIIAVMSNGIENIDLKACQNYGIKVTNVPGVTTDAIADYTLALLLMGIRRIDQSLQQSHHQITPYYLWNLQGFALSQLTIGIVGMGQIGSAIAQRLVGFEPRILYYSRKRKIKVEHQYLLKYTSFEQLLAESDAVIVCCSLNKSSQNLFKLQTFKQMKLSAIFINIARGEICNHQDLYTALKEGLISLALLDVTEPEPLPKTHPLVQINNCLIFPHIATNTQDSRIKICNIAIKEICQVLK
ncbi:MAG: NAD(P)-dependent oxidoreductase [Microcoleaceae cyanobacterium]